MENKDYLHILELTISKGVSEFKHVKDGPVTPKEAMARMIYSFKGYKSYQYSRFEYDSEKAKSFLKIISEKKKNYNLKLKKLLAF